MSLKLRTEFAVEKKNEVFFTGHHLQVNKEGTHIFCQCSETVNIIELSTGTVISKIECEEDEVTSIALSPNNESLAIGLNSATLKHYDVKNLMSAQIVTSIKSYHRGPITTMCWDSSSTYLATGSSDGTARVWDLKQKFCTHSLKGAHGVFRVLMFDPNLCERQWIFGAADHVIYIWLLQAGDSTLVKKLEEHTSSVTGMQLTPLRNNLISCGLDKVLILWDLEKLSSVKIIPVFESLSGIICKPKELNLPLSDDVENSILTIGNKGCLSVWDMEKGKELWRSPQPLVQPTEKEILLVNQFLLVPAHKSVVLATYDHSIIIYNLETKLVWKQLSGFNDDIVDIIFIGENDSHLVVATNSSFIRVYDNKTLDCHFVGGHTGNVLGLAKHPTKDSIFVSCSHDNTAKVWKLTGDGAAVCLATASGHTHSVGCLAIAADILITGSRDTCVKKWHIDESVLTDCSSEDKSLVSSGTVKAHDKDVNSVAISKNLALIASSSQDKTAKIWDGQSVDLLGVLSGHRKSVWCIQFSPVDRIVATASADGTIKIWSLTTYSNVATLEGHEVAVLRLSWLNQGSQLISTAADGLLKVWSLKDKLCVGTFDEHEGRTFALAVSEGEEKIATAGSDSCIVWWKDITDEIREKKHAEERKLIEEEQTLLNLVQKKKWKKALRYAIHLRQPYRALTTMKQLLDETPSELNNVLNTLKDEDISILLDYAVQWNTKTRNVRESQSIINYLLKERLPEEIESLPDWQAALEGLLPYTERHCKRLSCLQQSAEILKYVATNSTLLPESSLVSTDSKIDEDLALLKSIPLSNKVYTPGEDDSTKRISDEGVYSGYSSEELEDDKNAPIRSIEDEAKFVFEKIIVDESEDDDSSENVKEVYFDSEDDENYNSEIS